MPRRYRKNSPKKRPVKHSGTVIDNMGQGSNAQSLIVLKTTGGPRSVDGSPQTIQSSSSTEEDCRTGDTVKFINLLVEVAPRTTVATDADRVGWLEWAFMCVRENETAVPSTRLGVQTLGDICTNMYRGECIYTGVVPMGLTQPATAVIKLKIPKTKHNIKLGDEWRFVTFFRAVSSTSTSTIAVRLVKSFNFLVRS